MIGIRRKSARLSQEWEAPKTPHKRGRKSAVFNLFNINQLTFKKKKKKKKGGRLYTCGQNDMCGQLGVRDVLIAKFPTLVPALQEIEITQVAAGAMHNIVLTDEGRVFTFGCNDAGALGRETEEEEEALKPTEVNFPEKVIQVSAGDSHSAALTVSGRVYICGSFRNHTGDIGLQPGKGKIILPYLIEFGNPGVLEPDIVKIGSGSNHLIAIAADGSLFTMGDGNIGQLGRHLSTRNLRSVTDLTRQDGYLKPKKVSDIHMKKVCDVWTGGTATFCKTEKGDIWVFGMNASSQLGFPSKTTEDEKENLNCYSVPKKVKSFNDHGPWKQFAAGDHHSLALNEQGHVYSFGRAHDGRLGLGEEEEEVKQPTRVLGLLENEKCVQIACGSSTSYAVTEDGKLYAWGFGESWQLGNGEKHDRFLPTQCKSSRGDVGINGKTLYVSAGSQHVAVIIANR